MRKSDKELEAAADTAEGASAGGKEEEEMERGEGVRAPRARKDGNEARAVASAAGRRRSD